MANRVLKPIHSMPNLKYTEKDIKVIRDYDIADGPYEYLYILDLRGTIYSKSIGIVYPKLLIFSDGELCPTDCAVDKTMINDYLK
jgi:hypothetical protein